MIASHITIIIITFGSFTIQKPVVELLPVSIEVIYNIKIKTIYVLLINKYINSIFILCVGMHQ